MKKSTIFILIALIAGLLIGYGMARQKSSAPEGEKDGYAEDEKGESADDKGPIKIGFIGPQTGDIASLGEIAKITAELAVKEINDAGGVKGRNIELIAEDSQCTPTGGTNAVNKLVNIDKVKAIVGGLCSAETAPAAPIAQKAGVPMVIYCASAPGITKVGNYIFRVYPSDTFQSVFAAEYAYNTLQKKNVAILYVKNDWGQGLHDGFTVRFKELGGTIVYDESFAQDSRDLRTQITKAKEANPDLLVFYSYPDAAVPGLKQAKELELAVPILGGDAFDDPKVPTEGAESAEGLMYSVTKLPIPEDFKAKFFAATGKEIKICGPHAYDAVKLLAKVMESAGSGKAAIRDELAKVKDYPGVSGVITFNADGDITNNEYEVKVIKGGKVETVQ